jgi:hypothetical protein
MPSEQEERLDFVGSTVPTVIPLPTTFGGTIVIDVLPGWS